MRRGLFARFSLLERRIGIEPQRRDGSLKMTASVPSLTVIDAPDRLLFDHKAGIAV
jgi:hypothetical protein